MNLTVVEYQIKARFALAESYDRATKAQLDEEIARQTGAALEADRQPDVIEDKPAEDEQAVEENPQVDPDAESNDPSDGTSSFKQKLMAQ